MIPAGKTTSALRGSPVAWHTTNCRISAASACFGVAYQHTLKLSASPPSKGQDADAGTIRVCINVKAPNLYDRFTGEANGTLEVEVEVEAPPLAFPGLSVIRDVSKEIDALHAKLKRIDEPGRIQAEMTQQVIDGDTRLLGLLVALIERIG